MILIMKKAQVGVLLFDISTTSCWDCQIIEPSCQTDAWLFRVIESDMTFDSSYFIFLCFWKSQQKIYNLVLLQITFYLYFVLQLLLLRGFNWNENWTFALLLILLSKYRILVISLKEDCVLNDRCMQTTLTFELLLLLIKLTK